MVETKGSKNKPLKKPKDIPKEVSKKKSSKEKPKRITYSTCVKCGNKFPTSEMYVHSGKKYCEDCYEEIKSESEYYRKLCDYIYKEIYHEDCNMPFITSQIKKLKQEIEGLTNRRILITLQYAIKYDKFDTTDLDPEWGINNLVIKYYYETKKFYDLKQKINKDKDEIDRMLNIKTKVVIINRSDIIKRQEQYEEEQRKRYAKQMLDEDDMKEIMECLEKYGTKENLGFKSD